MRVAIVIICIALAGCAPSMQRQPIDIFAELSKGTWDFEGYDGECENPATHWFSTDRKHMYATRPGGSYIGDGIARSLIEYEIVSVSDFEIEMDLVQEVRMGPDGKPVRWTIVMLSESEFCWHVDYWPKYKCTEVVSRCPHDT
jgi:hypothetical protein